MSIAFVDDQRSSNARTSSQLSNYMNVVTRLQEQRVRVDRHMGIPVALIERYIEAAVRRAVVDRVDGRWFAEVNSFEGVYGEGESRDGAIEDLRESLPMWIELKIRAGASLPKVNGVYIPTKFDG